MTTGARSFGRRPEMYAVTFVTVIGLFTAFFSLTGHGLWGDEVWSASWSQQQAWPQTFSRFLSPPDLPLNFLLVQLSTTFGQSEFWVRLPSALLGAATCPVLFLLGRTVYGAATGVCAAVLLAVAPYHVWYAQDARPYAPLALYAVLSLYFFVRLLQRPSVGSAIGFMVVTTLDMYNHLFGVFPLIVELVVVIPWAVVRGTQIRRGPLSPVDPPQGPKVSRRKLALSREREQHRQWTTYRFTLAALGGATAAALLACLPLYSGIAQYIENAGPSEVPQPAFVMTPRFVTDLFAAFGSGTWWPFWLLAILFGLAVAADLRQRRWFVALGLAWLAIPLALVALARPHHLVGPR
ncbi:MAG TPA: glycosyltransferase family 39 protein, partial [Chloroflexota bacterium]